MEEISSTVVLPVTDAQMTAFSTWVIETYETYDGFQAAIKLPEIDTYIKTHILPQEMNTVLRMSQPYIGEKYGDVNIQWLLMNRRRVTAKMNNLKGKIGLITFPVETKQAIRESRNAARTRRLAREAEQLHFQQERQAYIDHMNATLESRSQEIYDRRVAMERARLEPSTQIILPTIEILTQEEADTCVMDDDCVICLSTHKLTAACTLNCGHQFGGLCLAKWNKDTCPLCRTRFADITVYVGPLVLKLTDNDLAILDTVVA